MAAQLPSHSAPFVDPNTGLVNTQWYQFLSQFVRDLGAESTSRAAEIEALEASIDGDAATVLLRANNLSDVANAATARANLGIAWEKISQGDEVNVTSSNIELPGGYRAFQLLVHHARQTSTANVAVRFRMAGTFAVAGYNYSLRSVTDAGVVATVSSTSASEILFGSGDAAAEQGTAINIVMHFNADARPRLTFQTSASIAGTGIHYAGQGILETPGIPDYLGMLPLSGTFAVFNWTLMGLRG